MNHQSIKELDKQLDYLYNGKLLSENGINELCTKVKQIFKEEPNIIKFSTPVILCGDIHGQFQDLLMILDEISGKVQNTKYIFLGDYVDRGHHSVETISFLLALKVKYRERIILLRGNHQSRQMSQVYGFYDECMKKYGNSNVWKVLTDVFVYLPLTAVIDNSILCVHGGLSPSIQTLENIHCLKRFNQIPNDGPICDILWSVPSENLGWGINPRGSGFTFGQNISEEFNYTNKLKMIARSHQFLMKGWQTTHKNNVTTIFSAPNYLKKCGNQGAILKIEEDLSCNYIVYGPVSAKTK